MEVSSTDHFTSDEISWESLKRKTINQISKSDQLLLAEALEFDSLLEFVSESGTQVQCQNLADVYHKLQAGIPLPYIIKQCYFAGHKLEVTHDVLIPRFDTETLVEYASETIRQNRMAGESYKVIDMGTGSGAIAISLAKLFPRLDITATDISACALQLAQRNAERNGCDNIQFIHSNWGENIDGKFDLILSNPPYLRLEEIEQNKDLHCEPALALLGDLPIANSMRNGMDCYAALLDSMREHISSNGKVIFEHGWQQTSFMVAMLKQHKFNAIETIQDMAKRDRVTSAVYL